MTDVPVKPISEIEVKSEVSADDKILILDSVSEEARLASKDELKGDKWDQWDPWTPWADGQDGKDGKDWADWKDWVDGAAATITVGSTTTWAAWTSASVTNSWTSSAAVLDFTIPKWDKGDTWAAWADWEDGQDGADWNWITSVTSSKSWKTTTVTMNFDEWDPFSFEVQDWADGQWAWDVIWPNSSTDWDVVLFDWTSWKLIKDSWVQLGTAASKNTWTSSGNVPVLDSNWKLNTSTLPWVALTDTFTVTNKSDLTSLSNADQWDIGIVTSESKTYVLSQAPYSTLSNWKELLSPTDAVTSVNSKTWAVTLNADDISDSTTTNKFVTATDKTTWGNKQDALTLPWSPTSWHLVTWGANNKTLADGWAIPTGLPSGWTTGQVVKKTADWAEWANESWAVTSVNWNTWAVTVSEFTPSWTATTGYVVTKTNNGYEWAAPSGWIGISSQSNNILTSWATIRAGSQSDYENLWSYDNNTVYLTI